MDSTTQITEEAAIAPGDGAVASANLAGLVDVSSPEPEREAAPESNELTSLDVAPPEVEQAVEAQVPAEVSEVAFNPLTSVLGDIDELQTVARRMLHNFRIAYEIEKQKMGQSSNASETRMAERELKLQKMERDFSRRQAEFGALADDPKVREMLSAPEGELPDILSEEGISARIQQGIAEGMRRVLTPMQEASARHNKEATYLEFMESHPELAEPGFKKEGRRASSAPISTQDAYQIVKARRVLAEQNARSTAERRARAESARRVSKQSMSSAPGVEDIPQDVKKRGAYAIAHWLQSNPEAAKRISGQVR